MAKVLVPLADGFEEIEAITVVDRAASRRNRGLHRGGSEPIRMALQTVTGSHAIASRPIPGSTDVDDADST